MRLRSISNHRPDFLHIFSLALEESRSISENVIWGKRKSFQDGKLIMPYKSFLGYTKCMDDKPIIVLEEAAIVRRIYCLFMEGKTVNTIARLLTKESIPTPRNNSKWYDSTIKSILTNEKYKGDDLLQKTYGFNFLTKESLIRIFFSLFTKVNKCCYDKGVYQINKLTAN